MLRSIVVAEARKHGSDLQSVCESMGRSSGNVDREPETQASRGVAHSCRQNESDSRNGSGRRCRMSHKGLFLVKELSACVEREYEDLSEYSMFRAHTLKLLRHYLRLSLDYGRIPSVLGGEMMRARVSNTRMHTIEDETIFIHDMNRCLERELDGDELRLMALIVFMEHTFEEAALILHYSEKQLRRKFPPIMDRLTRAFFEREFLNHEKLMGGTKKPMGRAQINTIRANAVV
jgi:hypothetical protein